MSLKQNLDSYSTLELKEFIKAHNKRVRGMIKEEVKEFRKEKLSELIIKAVGKKPDLIEKMDKIAKKKDVSSFKLIKTKGKMSQNKKDQLDAVQMKETEQLFKDYQSQKINKKQLRKEINEIDKERIRAELPKLKVNLLIKVIDKNISEGLDFNGQQIKKNVKEYVVGQASKLPIPKITITEAKPPQPKRKAPTLAEVRAKNLKEKRDKMKPKGPPPKRKRGKAPEVPENLELKVKEKPKPKEPKSEPDSEEPKSEFKLPKFYDTASPEIKKNLIKGVNNNILSSNPALLKAQYKGAKLIKKGLNENKSNEERIEGLSRAMDALEDDKDQEIYKAIYNAKLNKKKINDLFLKIGTELMVGDRDDRKSFRPYLSKQKLEVQKKFLRKNKEAYLATVVGLNDKTGESKKVNDAVDRKMKEDKLKRQADFQAAKKERGE